MPKLPGKESTRRKIKLEDAWIDYFTGVWDGEVNKKPCVIEGCDHIAGGKINDEWKAGGPVGEEPWVVCGEGSQIAIVSNLPDDGKASDRQIRNRIKGVACVCCLNKLNKRADDEARAQHGDPD